MRNAVSGRRGRRHRDDWPASFAGTSRIRFGGSVAVATLSARHALPGGVFSCRQRSTASSVQRPGGDGGLRRMGAEPGDDVVDDRRALGLVVELVAEPRDRSAARRRGRPRGRRTPSVGTRPSSSPWRTSVGMPNPRAASRAGRAPARQGRGPEPGGGGLDAERVVDGLRRRPTDRATASSRRSRSGSSSVGRDPRRARGASAFFQPGSAESSAGDVRTARSGFGRSVRR